MPEATKPPERPKPEESKPARRVDFDALAASSNPDVHRLLAEREIAVRNREALDVAEADVKAADEAIAAIDKQLSEL
jgi:hypothetical protein